MKANLPPRRLIPRWRRTKAVLDMPEATFTTSKATHRLELDPLTLDHAIQKWKSAPTTGRLGDILSYSIDPALRSIIVDLVRNDRACRDAATVSQAHFLQQLTADDDADSSSLNLDDLRRTLGLCNPAIKQEVSTLRRILNANPANPLALLDLAQFQLTSGHTKQAKRSVLTALSLSPNNRTALRTMARLLVHEREFEKAHSLIRMHARTGSDPWLMATEIALAEVAETPSKFAKIGFKFARDKMANNAHLSELAGALGGADLQAGNVKRARDMFRLALLAPNDNVVAQAVTHQPLLGLDLSAPTQQLAVMSAHEARTLLAWEQLDSENAELHALVWHAEEPFSSRPLQFLTTIYAARRDYSSSAILARRGLVSDPRDAALLSNLAYVSACDGKTDEAEKLLVQLMALKDPQYTGVLLATAGLIVMQQGSWTEADKFYETAMRTFRERREFVREALCCAYFARSASDTDHPNRSSILARAEAMYKQHPSPDAAIVLKLLNPDIQPKEHFEGPRRLSQWVFDFKNESLIQVHGITDPGAPALIFKN